MTRFRKKHKLNKQGLAEINPDFGNLYGEFSNGPTMFPASYEYYKK